MCGIFYMEKEQIKKILFEMKLYDGQIEKWSAFDIVNYWLPLHGEIWVERFKQRLVHSVIDYTPESMSRCLVKNQNCHMRSKIFI